MEASLRHLLLFLRDLRRFRCVCLSLSPVKPLDKGELAGVVSQVMPVGLSPDNKHMWTQLAKWYLGLWKGGNDLYIWLILQKRTRHH